MPKVRIEHMPVFNYFLGFFGFSHMQLTLQPWAFDDKGLQDKWLVMEGVLDGNSLFNATLGVAGADGTRTMSQANENLELFPLFELIGTPEMRGSRALSESVEATRDWATFVQYGTDIENQALPYQAIDFPGSPVPVLNSSSVVATLLYRAGYDIRQHMPYDVGYSPGTTTLIGSEAGEALAITMGFTAVVGGGGRDTLSGGSDNSNTDRLYGGLGDDLFKWSGGFNIYNGGLPGQSMVTDGDDHVDYDGIGIVHMAQFSYVRNHTLPEYVTTHSGGHDWLFSVEGVEWDLDNDQIITDGNITIIRDDILLDLKGEDDAHGDEASFEHHSGNLLINAGEGDLVLVQADDAVNSDIGIWVRSAEWLIGSTGNDSIFGGAGQRGLEGGDGDDVIDGRLSTPFSSVSPLGYDVEMTGGEGNDTIVSGAGYSLVTGGDGADAFVLSSMSGADGITEFVIADASSEDRVLVPVDFFNLTYGTFDNSALFPLLGAMAQVPGHASFADLPQTLGPWATGPDARSDYFGFEWRTQNQIWNSSNETAGVIPFAGAIDYNRDGADLLIHLFIGYAFEFTEIGHNDEPYTHTINGIDPTTETVIRVLNFHEGDLGIHFYDPGVPSEIDIETILGPSSVYTYPNWDAAVLAMTGGGLEDALELRPETPVYQSGGSGETARAVGALNLTGGSGADTLSGQAGDDTLNGGGGADQLSGGRGNDTYIVDHLSDRVIEVSGAGADIVVSSVSGYVLSSDVEELELSGSALSGTGNNGHNSLVGNGLNNTLTGLGGEDGFFGGAGNDTLIGGAGNDGYFFQPGDGYDVIRDFGDSTDHDILILNGIAARDVHLLRSAADPDDLIFVFESGGRILADEYFAGGGRSVDGVMFLDGTTWTAAELASRALAAPVVGNEAPIAQDEVGFGVLAGGTLIPYAMLLGNDADYEGDRLSVTAVQSLVSGVSVRMEVGGVRVIAPLSYSGAGDFRYTVSDGHGGTDTATMDLVVRANHAPTVTGRIADASVASGQSYRLTLPSTLFHDQDGNALGLSVRQASGAGLPSWLRFDAATRTLSGTPPAGTSGQLDIVVTASDGGASVSTGYRLTVTTGGHAPVAVDDSGFRVLPGGLLRLPEASMTGNDRDADGQSLTITSVSGAAHGSVVLGADHSVLFRAAAGYTGLASFQYTVSDGHGGTDRATVSVMVSDDISLTRVSGTAGNNVLFGTSGADRIEGRGGNDGLYGHGGDDVFFYSGTGTGRDVIVGGAGYDMVLGSDGADVILLPTDARAFSVEAIVGGGGWDRLSGTSGGDVINLSSIVVTGIERISGGAGNDRITGSGSADRLEGGRGADVFVFAGSCGRDSIVDFQTGTAAHPRFDVIDLSDFEFASFAAVMARATDTGSDTVITLSASASLRLTGIDKADLRANDFWL